ncbi:hypothetical protein [Shimazuella kribbensis]|uniref:hypothetical protein n=1 Tax=Shimazuella kribbensis TaxID=139808 RepID=UPI00041C5CD1|nr:hypothetical protein [Shimazuella kribbensis]
MRRKLGSDMQKLKQKASQVPGMKEFHNSFPVIVGKTLLKRRLDLKMDHEQFSTHVWIKSGKKIPADLLYRMEWADPDISLSRYKWALDALPVEPKESSSQAFS